MSESNVIPLHPPEREIAPCRFCGCDDPELEQEPAEACGDTYHWVECGECGARGPRTFYGCRDPREEAIDLEAEAVELWNPPKSLRFIHLHVCEACKERVLRFPAEPGSMRDGFVTMPPGLCAECEGKMTQCLRLLLTGGKVLYE